MAEYYFIVQMSLSYFIHSFLDRHLGCFQFLAIVNNTAMNIGMLCSFKLMFWVPSNIFPGVGLLGQNTGLFLIFWGISILLFTVATPVCIPTNSAKGFPFLHILASTCCLHFSDYHWCWASFHMSIGHLYILFEEVSIQVLCPFLFGLGGFFGVEFCKFFINFGY